MYVCICHAVTDSDLGRALDSGATTLDEVGARTGAGSGCGTCHDHIESLIEARCTTCPLAAMQVA